MQNTDYLSLTSKLKTDGLDYYRRTSYNHRTQILCVHKQLNNNKEDLRKVTKRDTTLVRPYRENFREDFRLNREESRLVAKDNREELARSMNEFKEAFERGIDSFNRLQKEKFAALDERQQRISG